MIATSKIRWLGVGLLCLSVSKGRADDAADWLNQFYSDRGVCVASTSVVNVVAREQAVTVVLESDQQYVERVKRGGDEIVRDWLALHCPLPLVAYTQVLGGRDVVVQLEGMGTLSCAAFEENRN